MRDTKKMNGIFGGKTMKAKIINAFTDKISGGNPAGVITDPLNYSYNQMVEISRKLAVSETAFIYPSIIADYKLRFFSPKIEVNLCGHATIATFFYLAETRKFDNSKDKISVTQETNTGILPIEILFENNNVVKVMMTQNKLKVVDIELNYKNIAESLGIKEIEIIKSIPKQIVSTGLFTLPIEVDSLLTLKKLKPNFDKIKKICLEKKCGSIHIFSFDTIENNSIYHARNFAPLYGINEDPVTGTANGAVSEFLLKNRFILKNKFICEQGDIIGRPGRIHIEIDNYNVKVGGKAKFVKEIDIQV